MNDFIYQNTTKIYFGRDQLKNLGAELRKYGQRVLLVYGGGSIKKIGLYDKVLKEIEASGLKRFELSGVEPNPRHTTVKFSVMAQKACAGGTLYGFKPLTPKDVEAIYRMRL